MSKKPQPPPTDAQASEAGHPGLTDVYFEGPPTNLYHRADQYDPFPDDERLYRQQADAREGVPCPRCFPAEPAAAARRYQPPPSAELSESPEKFRRLSDDQRASLYDDVQALFSAVDQRIDAEVPGETMASTSTSPESDQ